MSHSQSTTDGVIEGIVAFVVHFYDAAVDVSFLSPFISQGFPFMGFPIPIKDLAHL
jgi:hypothetical protein